MQQTTNYQLNQWEKSDRILMENFNQDNEKIDAALAALNQPRSPFIKIKEFTSSEDAVSLTMSLSDVDWNAWQVVRIDVSLRGPSSDTAMIYANDSSGRHCHIRGTTYESGLAPAEVSITALNPIPTHLFLIPMGGSHHYIRGLMFSSDRMGYCFWTTTPFASMTHLTVSSPVTLSPGCTITVWGLL